MKAMNLILLLAIFAVIPIASAETVNLKENSDICRYIPALDLDYCYAIYDVCEVSLSDVQKATFLFQDEKSGYKTDLQTLVQKHIDIQDNGICKELTISAYKNPFVNIDNVLCTQTKCYYKWKWWNSSFQTKYPINTSCAPCTNPITGMWYINDSLGFDIGGGLEYATAIFTANPTRTDDMSLYVQNDTLYRVVNETDENNPFSVPTIVDQGIGLSFNQAPNDLVAWYTLQDNNTVNDSSQYGHDSVSISGTPSIQPGQIGDSLLFDGTTDSINFGNVQDVNGLSALSVCAWYNIDNNEDGAFASKHDSGAGATYGWILSWASAPSAVDLHISTGGGTWYGTSFVVPSGGWNHVCGTYDGETMRLYWNGIEEDTNTDPSGSINSNNANFMVADRSNGAYDLSGNIDGVRVFNITLSQEEIQAIYNNTVGGQNFAPLGTPLTFSANSSIFGTNFTVDDFTFSSSTFITLMNLSLNTSLNSSYILLSSMNLAKNSGAGSNDVSVRIILDDATILEETLRTVTGTSDIGSTGTRPILFNLTTGEHSLAYQFSRTGNGQIAVNNIDVVLLDMVSVAEYTIRAQQVNLSYSHSNLDYTPAFNWSINKSINSSTAMITKMTVDKILAGNSIASYKFLDRSNNNESPFWARLITSATDIGSLSSTYIQEVFEPTHDWSILSRQSNAGDTVNVNGTLVDFDLSDNIENVIPNFQTTNTGTNETQSLNLSAGENLIVSENITVISGDSYFLSMTTTFQSQSGEQTPKYFINATGANCRSEKDRYLSSNTEIGNAFIYFICNDLSIGTSYEFNLYVIVEVGETLTQLDESFNGFETTLLDITTGNVAPIPNDITNPTNGSNVTGSDLITWNAFFDPNSDTVTYNVTLNNINGSYNATIGTTLATSLTVNWNAFLDGDYLLFVTGSDPSGLSSNTSITITIFTPPPPPTFNISFVFSVGDTLPIKTMYCIGDVLVTERERENCETTTGACATINQTETRNCPFGCEDNLTKLGADCIPTDYETLVSGWGLFFIAFVALLAGSFLLKKKKKKKKQRWL